MKTLESLDSLNDKEDTFLLKGLTYLGIGEWEEALKVFKKVFVDETDEQKESKLDQFEFRNIVRPIFHSVELERESYIQNKQFNTPH